MRPFVSALVLAAGTSARLGRPKQLLPFGATTLLGRVVSEARAATALDEIVVVIGGAAEQVRQQVDLAGVTVVQNAQFREGCAASYRTGIAALDARAEAVAVLLGDQPGIEAVVIDSVVDAWRRTRDRIMLASYRARDGHPLVFAQSLFPLLTALHGDKAAWKIVDAHRDWVCPVAVDRPHPRDVNTWEEYQALLREAVDPILTPSPSLRLGGESDR
jgi:molybdenum cofactor cytidylyltransferase